MKKIVLKMKIYDFQEEITKNYVSFLFNIIHKNDEKENDNDH